MSKYSEFFESMQPEEVEAFITSFRGKPFPSPGNLLSEEDLNNIFRFREALRLMNEHEEAAELFWDIKILIDDFIAAGSDPEAGLQFLNEWTLLVISNTTEKATDFVCMPYYHELLAAYKNAPPKFRNDEFRAKLQMLHHFLLWKENGGKPELLEPDLKQELESMEIEYIPEIETKITEQKAEENWRAVFDLSKSMQRFYMARKKPNESIIWMKTAMEILPQTPDFKETELADLHLDLGELFFGYKKYDAAIRNFEKAKELFQNAGEEYEMKFYQAEGWEDEARKMKS